MALLVMAAIQVEQTRTALVWRTAEQCAIDFSPIVSINSFCEGYLIANNWLVAMRWSRNLVQPD